MFNIYYKYPTTFIEHEIPYLVVVDCSVCALVAMYVCRRTIDNPNVIITIEYLWLSI